MSKKNTKTRILLILEHEHFKVLKKAKLKYSAKLGEDLTWEDYIIARCLGY